jgi:hypothetical protein
MAMIAYKEVLKATDYIIARRVYVFPEFLLSTFYTWTVKQRFRSFAADRWHLDTFPPSGAGVVNRPNGTARRVDDLRDLADGWRLQWPSWGWNYTESFLSLRDAAHWVNTKKVVVAASGAACLNAVFMQKGGCLVELQPESCYEFFQHLAAAIGLDYVSMRVPGLIHWSPPGASLGRERAAALARFIVQRYPLQAQ